MNIWIKIDCTHGLLGCLQYIVRHIMKVICQIWNEDIYITSTDEGNHIAYSKHYFGEAIDIRPPKTDRENKINKLKERLGEDFDVIDEGDHVHVEYDPKED